jgi:hypothetical protein
MTVQELVNFCAANGIDLSTHIALRAKDDYLLTAGKVSLDKTYFGNCRDGDALLEKIAPRDDDGEVDYDNAPQFLVLDTQRG